MRHNCPVEGWADAWIETPDIWLGRHGNRYAEAAQKGDGKYFGPIADFAAYLAVLDNWDLPGLNGPPDKWDILEIPLSVIAWVNRTVRPLFQANFIVPKASLPRSLETGQADTEPVETT